MGKELKGKLQEFDYRKTKKEEEELEKEKFNDKNSPYNTIKNGSNLNILLNGLSAKLNTIQKFNLGNDSD